MASVTALKSDASPFAAESADPFTLRVRLAARDRTIAEMKALLFRCAEELQCGDREHRQALSDEVLAALEALS